MCSARQPSHSPHRGVRSNDVRDTRSPATSWSRSYVSRSSTCQVSAEVTSSPELVVTGGDDYALSEHWAISLAGAYPDYRQTARMELTTANRSESYAGIATTFSASIAGSQVVGRSFVRVWSADSAALPVCQQGSFDTTSWDAVVHGITIYGLSGQSRWPERSPEPATPTAPPPAEPPPPV